ncbi:protein RER1A-like [Eucalyptus grandis]|uniref:protein RER1A-like n=1 Tax=Eucalyptus grandis TaxID=71139 RepID=UPI00192ED6B9|nr:protein RER1A-like [Eucalyptus grandis]
MALGLMDEGGARVGERCPDLGEVHGPLPFLVRAYWPLPLLVRGYFVRGIYMLNRLIGFLYPQVDPELQELADGGGPSLPTRGSDKFRPFVRRLPEFKCWLQITWAFVIAFVMTFFRVFDIPVFWPILLFYWVMLFTLTMRRQIMLNTNMSHLLVS